MRGVDGTIAITVPAAIDSASAARFIQQFLRAARDDSSRVILLTGEDGVFSRGMQPSTSDAADLRNHLHRFAESLLAVRYAQKPVIAIIDGIAVGGGMGLAASADIVIASNRSTFGLPETLFGFFPAVILPLLLERMRSKDCRMWMLTAHSRPASDALAAGLVDFVCPQEELEAMTARLVRQLMRVDKNVVAAVKRLTSRADLERAVRDGVQATTAMLSNPAVSQALYRFFAEGAAPWEQS
jgi:polyketide biosynthesis enoyl-CoA hydratase PksH